MMIIRGIKKIKMIKMLKGIILKKMAREMTRKGMGKKKGKRMTLIRIFPIMKIYLQMLILQVKL